MKRSVGLLVVGGYAICMAGEEPSELKVEARRVEIVYETVFVEGRSWVTGFDGQVAVATALTLGNPMDLELVVVSAAEHKVLFDPTMVIAVARLTGGELLPLTVLTPEQVAARVKSTQTSRRIAMAFSAGLGAHARALDSSMTQYERDVLGRLDQNDVRAVGDRITVEGDVLMDGVAKRHTVFPGKGYGGHVYVRSKKARQMALLEITFRVNEKNFQFRFDTK